jgi:dTDP-4-dehydrorhamnose 3,5-epimerase
MEVNSLAIQDVLIIKPHIHEDHRGFLFEAFNQLRFNEVLKDNINFVQDIHSFSFKNVLRGLHYQINPNSQAKLIRVIKGEIFDVAIDLRKNSITFGCWVSNILSEDNRLQMLIPQGFAHGYLILSEYAEVNYKVTSLYNQQTERCIRWNDKTLDIKWPISSTPIISKRDALGLSFKDAEIYF